MTDLVAFLRARLDEDEAAIGGPDELDPDKGHRLTDDFQFGVLLIPKIRVLREVEAKRRIVDEHANVNDGDCGTCVIGLWGYPTHGGSRPESWPCPTLRLLALPYADHPAYRAEWAP